MSTKIIVIIALVLVTTTLLSLSILHNHAGLIEEQQDMGEKIKLPEPCNTSNTSVEAALSQRRSIRAYSGDKFNHRRGITAIMVCSRVLPHPGAEEQHLLRGLCIHLSYT